jgi:hypothetical protein
MQDAQALIQQIDALSKQNNTLTDELNNLKTKLQDMQGQSGGQSGGQAQSKGQQSGGQSGADPTARLAGELKQLKGMVQSLESKMSSFVSAQSSGNQLSQADVVNLLLTVMDGMIDWSVDYVSSQSQSQSQSSGNQSQPLQ